MDDIKNLMNELTEFYPKHIEKEDKHFFIPVMKYFTKIEQDKMLIHEKYEKVIESLQNK